MTEGQTPHSLRDQGQWEWLSPEVLSVHAEYYLFISINIQYQYVCGRCGGESMERERVIYVCYLETAACLD